MTCQVFVEKPCSKAKIYKLAPQKYNFFKHISKAFVLIRNARRTNYLSASLL